MPRVVAGTYFEISVQSRGKEWTVQKKITQFEELHKELLDLFTRELEGVAVFPQPGMFQSREVGVLLRLPSPHSFIIAQDHTRRVVSRTRRCSSRADTMQTSF